MEIHSPNIVFNDNEKWIFRLSYGSTTNKNEKYYLQPEGEKYNFNGEFHGRDSHIEIDSPLEDNNLLNNIEFQAIMSQLSKSIYEEHNATIINAYLGIREQKEGTLRACLKDPIAYSKFKDFITEEREKLGKYALQ